MQSNGPLCMYKTKPIITRDVNNPVSLPDTMYKMKNIHTNGSGEKGSDHVSTASTKKSGIITEQKLETSSEITILMQRQQNILRELDELRHQMVSLKADLSNNKGIVSDVFQSTFICPLEVAKFPNIIINASPAYPPYSLLMIQKLCKNGFHLLVTTHLHSSVTAHANIGKFQQALETYTPDNKTIINIRLIWKNVGPNTELILTQTPIVGEVNILRYFSRMIPNILKYEQLENYYDIDYILDVCHSFVISKSKAEQTKFVQNLSSKVDKSNWLCGATSISIADIAAYSVIKQTGCNALGQNLSKWFQKCETL